MELSDRNYLLRLFQAQTIVEWILTTSALSSCGDSSKCTHSIIMKSVLIPIEAIASINDILRPFNLEILQSNSGESIELVGTLVNVDNFQHFSGSVPPIDPSLFIEPLLSRLKLSLFEMCPCLSSTKFDSVSCILTGQDGYDGGFMIEVLCDYFSERRISLN